MLRVVVCIARQVVTPACNIYSSPEPFPCTTPHNSFPVQYLFHGQLSPEIVQQIESFTYSDFMWCLGTPNTLHSKFCISYSANGLLQIQI